jgi:ABC-type Fe3+-siderophore transport system permease subunit
MSRFGAYLRDISAGCAALWCCLIWYLTMTAYYSEPAPRLWLTSLGLSVIIGIALMLSVRTHGGARQHRWQVFRLVLIPFAVSSFSALIKDRGLILIFSPSLAQDAVAVSFQRSRKAAVQSGSM